jgi:ubiquinone/menaquinone biosynthesis C-methylase UbiE
VRCRIKPVRGTLRKEGAGHDEAQALMTSPHGLATAKGGPVMAEAIADRVRRYILDGSDEDLRRLLGVAETTREMARSAFRRVGMQEGWRAIDCGCGPIGGLAVMAEMVGPAGQVVGVDFSEATIQRARSVVAALRLGNVELLAGDIHELGADAVGGPFDLAYTRLFLMHQPDPVRTLSQIARLLRPGGWVVAQEALRNPPPRSYPHLDALGAYWDLVYQVLERAGDVPYGAVDGLAGSARTAGLDVVAVDGSFGIIDPELGFDLHAATLLAARERAVASGIATGQQIDDLVSDLHTAKSGGYEWVSTPFLLDLTLRRPLAA